MKEIIRVMFFDDNNNLREGISFLLSNTPGIQFIGGYQNCNNLEKLIVEEQPDVVLMDIEMPGRTGIEAVKIIKESAKETLVIMLTVFDDDENIFLSICNGASGYLLKKSSPAEIVQSIFDVKRGGSPLTPNVARRVLSFFQKEGSTLPAEKYHLSNRELDILQSLTEGFGYKMIASKNYISIDTVRSHIRHIYEKLQVHSKSEAVAKAILEKITKKNKPG